MAEAVQNLILYICDDYTARQSRSSILHSEIREKMNQEFIKGMNFLAGKKYIKIVLKTPAQTTVKLFVVNCHDDKQFRYGDILKPAGWGSPARNFTRGNIFGGDFREIHWTGA